MLGQERSWAEGITKARTLRGTMFGAFQALQAPGRQSSGAWDTEMGERGQERGQGGLNTHSPLGHGEVADFYFQCDGEL